MRTKFLSILASFFILSAALSSCLNSDDDDIEYSTEATIYAFGLDTVLGRHYQFTIDQLQRIVYNRDSMPVGSDTILDRILIDTLTTSGWVTSGTPVDTLIDTTDSLDLRGAINSAGGLKLKVHAPDGLTSSEYILKINVHQQHPDSLVWKQVSGPANMHFEQQRAVILGDELWIFTGAATGHHRSISAYTGWTTDDLTGLPANMDVTSVIAFGDALYMRSTDDEVFSSTDGKNWTLVAALGSNVKALVAVVGNRLSAIVEVDGQRYFNTTDGQTWDETEPANLYEVEAGFPIGNFYAAATTTANGLDKVFVVGNQPAATDATTPWFSLDGKAWADLATDTDAGCPYLTNPSIIYYDDQLYIFGGEMEYIYTSGIGIAWYATTRNFLPHPDFKGRTAYSLVNDATGHLWMVFGGDGQPGEIWSGFVNKMGFVIK